MQQAVQAAHTNAFSLQPEALSCAQFTTYKVGGLIAKAYRPASLEQFKQWAATLNPSPPPPTVLGWGSNSLIAEAGISTPCLVTRKLTFVEPMLDASGAAIPGGFLIGAGVHLAKVAQLAIENGLSGGEFFIGIPGTMGGAVKMNAGAMGQETSSLIRRVLVYEWGTQQYLWLPVEALHYQYRYSAIAPAKHVVLAAECVFTPAEDLEACKARMAANMAFRKAHHPIQPNGGSVFRNPERNTSQEAVPSVGQMIEELGGKGSWRYGDAMVSPLHGNFIVNLGHATCSDVLQVMLRMKTEVAKAYCVEIFPENRLLGDVNAEEQTLWQQLKGHDTHED